MKFLKLFDNHSGYDSFTGTTEYIEPNVSHCIVEQHVHYHPITESVITAKFNVTTTSSAIQLRNENVNGFSKLEIDGVIQPSVKSWHTFETLGEHTVKYTLKDKTSIDDGAFRGCSAITSVEIPDGVQRIGVSPNGTYQGQVFSACTSLTSITIPNSVTHIGDASFHACSALTSVELPSGLLTIGLSLFNACKSLTSITIPNGVTTIMTNAFNSCASLTNITIPNSVMTIGNNAFKNCSSLTSVTIGNSVTSIGSQAFGVDTETTSSSLAVITCNATTPPTIQSNTFQTVKTGGTLYVPVGTEDIYYNRWLIGNKYYLGYYMWNIVEQ